MTLPMTSSEIRMTSPQLSRPPTSPQLSRAPTSPQLSRPPTSPQLSIHSSNLSMASTQHLSVCLFPDEVGNLEWYHPAASRHVAESLLLQNGQDGAYLLRPSSRPGELALSVRCHDSVKHFNIIWNGREYRFGMGCFLTIHDFISHCECQPLIAGESGVITLLKFPYPRDVEEPKTYEKIRIHTQLGRPQSPQTKGTFSLGSKEGYLTKQGGTVKQSWKTRWFVLIKNELKYYKEKVDREPIRILDLTECCQCCPEPDASKENCFKLVFPWRTFYLYATTETDMREWVTLLQWKIENIKKATQITS